MPDPRLHCYDEVAREVVERTRRMAVRNRFSWTRMDRGQGEERALTIALASSEGRASQDPGADRNGFFLTLVCRPSARTIDLYLAMPFQAADAPVSTTLTRNSGEAVQVPFQPSRSGAAIGVWSRRSADMVRLVAGASTVTLEAVYADGRRVYAEFDTAGFEAAFAPLAAECRMS